MKFLLRVPGSCGELAQGQIDGVRLHISCPVNRYTWGGFVDSGRNFPWRPGSKVRHLMSLIQSRKKPYPRPPMFFYSNLPVGKGMASSTADLAAAFYLNQNLTGSSYDLSDVVKLLLRVEPTDAVILPGIHLFDHFKGSVQRLLGEPPKIEILAIEFEETLDTVLFNQDDRKKIARAQSRNILQAFKLIESGIAERSTRKIGEGATISALAPQNILKKPYLEKLLKLNLKMGGVGVNVAHSGSVIGLLFNPGSLHYPSALRKVLAELKCPVRIHRLQLRGGGIDWLKEADRAV